MSEPSSTSTDLERAAALSPEVAEQFATMASLIPTETGDAVTNILGAILNAEDWEDLDKPWEASGAIKLEGKTLRIYDLVRRPSDYRDGLGVFLVVHYIDTDTGEAGVFTTSSVSITGQLVKAYAAGWLPLYAQVVVATRATEAGYKPHHLKFVGRDTADSQTV